MSFGPFPFFYMIIEQSPFIKKLQKAHHPSFLITNWIFPKNSYMIFMLKNRNGFQWFEIVTKLGIFFNYLTLSDVRFATTKNIEPTKAR